MDKEKITSLADEWMPSITVLSVSINDEIHTGFRIATNIDSGENTRKFSYLLLSTFGSYIVQQRLISEVGVENQEFLKHEMRRSYLDFVTLLARSNDPDYRKAVENTYDTFFKSFSEHVGSPATVLTTRLQEVFNQFSNIKFIENTFTNRLKLKTAFFIGSASPEFKEAHSKDYYIPIDSLQDVVPKVLNQFLELQPE